MRKLKTRDVFSFGGLIKAVGKDRFKGIAPKLEAAMSPETAGGGEKAKDAAVWDVGFEAAWILIDMSVDPDVERATYDFLSGPFEMTAEEVGDMDLTALAENLKRLGTENNMRDFFAAASKLVTR